MFNKAWIRAIRPFAFSASLVPVILGASVVLAQRAWAQWFYLPLIILAALLFHAATNAVSEYFDYRKGVDKKGTFGSSNVLVEGLLKPQAVLWLGLGLFGLGFLVAATVIAARGLPMLYLAIAGFLGGIFYTGWPVGYKYRGLGDIMVFILMGPLMVMGSFFALSGYFSKITFLISLPVGFLVMAILIANNVRDLAHDEEAGILTLECLLGVDFSRLWYVFSVIFPYLIIILLIKSGILSGWGWLVFLSAPLAGKNIRLMLSKSQDFSRSIAALDMFSAKLHMLFGILLILAVILPRIF